MPLKKIAKKFIQIPIKGLDTSGPAQFLDDRQTPDCQNVRIERSQIVQTPGFGLMGESFSANMMLFAEFTREADRFFLGFSTTKVKRWVNSLGLWNDITGASDLTGLATQPYSYAVAKIAGKSILVLTDYIDVLKKYDGGTAIATLGGTPPKAKYLLYFDGYLLAAGIKDGSDVYDERIQWPDTDDPETWTQNDITNAGYYDLSAGSPITGISRLRNLVVVATESSIWNGYLTGDSRVFHFESKETEMGFLANNTIRNIPGNKLLGLSKYGIIEYNGIQAQVVAPGIAEDLIWNTNPQYIQKSFAAVITELGEYWLFVPGLTSSYPNIVYKYNYITGQVLRDTCPNITALGLRSQREGMVWDAVEEKWDDVTGKWDDVVVRSIFPRLIIGDKNGQAYKLDYDEKNYGGTLTPILSRWASKDFYKQSLYSHWLRLDVDASGDALDVYYSINEGKTYTLLRQLTLTADMLTYRIPFSVLSHKIRFDFRNYYANSSYKLRNFTLFYTERECV